MLELQGLTRRYGDLVALNDLSFTVAEGQMFGFVGPNGAGKTTALRIVLGVLAPDAGEVRWRGQPMTDEIRKRLGYLPEDHGRTFSTQFAAQASSRLIVVTGAGATFPHLPSDTSASRTAPQSQHATDLAGGVHGRLAWELRRRARAWRPGFLSKAGCHRLCDRS